MQLHNKRWGLNMSLENYPNFLLNFSEGGMNGEDTHFYRFKSFRLNVEERQLLNNGNAIALTPKAFDVLALLVEHGGHLVEKNELLRIVWADSFVEEANIARIVHTLRKVLGEDGNGNKFIETVAKKGYRFVAEVNEDYESSVSRNRNGHSLFPYQKLSDFNSIHSNSLKNSPSNNLLSELSPLIGRNSELLETSDLLRQSNTRLLTITGVGGTGKTHLALAIAHKLLPEFTDGVYFIDLSMTRNPELVITIIGQTLGIGEVGGKSLKESVINFLREKKMLIVLDNFEQITEATPYISEFLTGSLNLKILVTSRVRLNLRCEHEFILQPLKFPDNKKSTFKQLTDYPAVELFVKRAKLIKSDFDLTEDNMESVAEICRELDGLPLAIELAAVRVKLLTPQLLLLRLKNRLKLLTGGAIDLPERHRTMSGTIAWSYDLLDADEKKLLNRLAVFAGGFTLAGVESVGNANADLSADPFDIVALLMDKSLLTQREQTNDEPRFWMLAVVREFMLEKLAESGEMNEIKRYHVMFYNDLSEKAETHLRLANAAEWFKALELEHENLRVAIEWSLENEPQTALRIVGAIHDFWGKRGYLTEGLSWMKKALEKASVDCNPNLSARVCFYVGYLNFRLEDFEAADLFFENSLQLSRKIDCQLLISTALGGLGNVKYMQGDFKSARVLMADGLKIAREINDKNRISIALINLASLNCDEESFAEAKKQYDEAYAIVKKELLYPLIPYCTASIASFDLQIGDFKSSRLNFLETLRVGEAMGDKRITCVALNSLAALSAKDGEIIMAAHLWGASQAIYEETGYKIEKYQRDFIFRYIKEARAKIGDKVFDTAQSEGRLMEMKDVITLASEPYNSDV